MVFFYFFRQDLLQVLSHLVFQGYAMKHRVNAAASDCLL